MSAVGVLTSGNDQATFEDHISFISTYYLSQFITVIRTSL